MNIAKKDTLTELIDDFALFDDWEERYRYLIDLGRALPNLPETMKRDEALVKGCTSRVWLYPEVTDGRLYFQADSDAHIVRGLVAILMKVYQGKRIADIKNIDIKSAFASIGLDQHLSPNRRSGFFAMVERLQAFAV